MDNNIETIETSLLKGRVKLIQPKHGFHASIDSVFLGAAVDAKDGSKILDIGCGVGSAGLCVTLRKKDILLTGIDIQQDLISIAEENARLNGIEERSLFVCGNLNEEKSIKNNSFDEVLMNPPYMEAGSHMVSPNKIKATAHGEEVSGATLEDWVRYAHHKLKQGGYLTIIHRTDRMDQLITTLTKRRWFGSLVIFPLWSYAGQDSKRLIIRCRKERYTPLKLKSGMVVHQKDGKYSHEAEEILSHAGYIDFN